MFREFFCASPKTAATAWAGLIVVVGYSLFVAHVKVQLNDFYARFYDLLQEGGVTSATLEQGSGSGDVYGSGEILPVAQNRQRVYDELWTFALIIAPLVSASPVCKWCRSAWAFSWRASLMKAYLVAWDTHNEPIEGASQRLHEDSQRFASGLEGCLVAVLDALFTLVVFSPILVHLGNEIAPPFDFGAINTAWLWCAAFASSCIGLVGAAFFGQKLVGLEVANQRVEALLRKDLVLLETTPAMIVGTEQSNTVSPGAVQRQVAFLPQTYFRNTLQSLWKNYFLLFRHFGVLNLWLSLFDQVMVIFPYLIAAPLIFAEDPSRRITLGTLIKMSNSFEKIFSSLSVIAENWGAINEFRSTYRRLREFEAKLYATSARVTTVGCLLPATATSVQLAEFRRPSRRIGPGPPAEFPYPIVDGSEVDAETRSRPLPPLATEPPSPPEPSSPSSDPGPSSATAAGVASMVVRALNGGGSGTLTREGVPIEVHINRHPDLDGMRV